ncbi:Menaquinone reductase, multiheme cytochrome c subunit [Fundidesulfovibrio magnetotacticus]|uniref:Menaquinone reductase, multiheme cytochrome c subunit n=1 Tax=Fundidesulfovibrio magnetotacticus TaxID=2730080 RepID=A0A6V8LRB3_9BACT|nr:cytochrome c3 family protein [Fundidesulfovibrio magnetotacticus]GFK95032.1 Menaquinone reductase, multiheme cytochrome c subunit [Fundidesulfovibrio magnetotacticus]
MERTPRRGALALAALGLALGLAAGWMAAPRFAWTALSQPVRFSHKAHLRQDLDCARCHFAGPGGGYSGFPRVGVCAACHAEPTGGRSEDERERDRLTALYVRPGRDVPWLCALRLPGHVRFVHAPHLDASCSSCHPDMRREDALNVTVNRVSGASRQAMTMDRCRSCHLERGAPSGCAACHG